jgi:MerR family transcriptional regulator/heat shock protein HspR
MVNIDSKPLFTLAVTAEIMGVHPRTLMIYEAEKLVIPARTRTNRRRYSQQDIRTLQFIQFLTRKKGVNLAGVEAIIQLITSAEKKGLDLRKTIFPEFIERQLV